MFKPYGVISDTHHHAWSAFATTESDGVNSRLRIILNETKRCAEQIKKLGGDTLYHGGDLFHTRGSIAPSVLNPTMDCYREILESGVNIVINAGNHDLESKTAKRVNSAITALEGIGCRVINEPTIMHGHGMAVIPWIQNISDLKEVIEAIDPFVRSGMDLLLHAPIDGVIPGLPDHGLTGDWLAALGFERVFSGHYHNHKEIIPNKVWSIGATTHQTWSDVGAKAGFLIVSDAGVKWNASHAPSFVEVDGSTDPDEIALIVDGNFVKVRITSSKSSDVEAIKQFLTDSGAKGVTVLSVPEVVIPARASGAVLKSGATLEASIGDYINSQAYKNKTALSTLCQNILSTVRSAA